MALYKLPSYDQLQDAQFVTVQGPDGILSGFQYNEETRTLYIKESQIVYPSFHGSTHISSDPIPCATIDSPGLLCQDDKAKLEALIQTKIGVLGFQGAGFPDDGGWLEGPIILASGSELLSIERIGNVVRFSVDSPVPLSCSCEECAQIYWIQDESETASIRPPSCGGTLPGVNAYGDVKFYLLPEGTILDQNDPLATLNQKDQYPAFVFKRYDNNVQYSGQLEVVLRRNENLTTSVGFAMTPGVSNSTVAETVWFTGEDDDGRTIRFDLDPETEPNLLGALLYKGHTLTRKMGVVTGYQSTILTTNQYNIKYWDVQNAQAIGNEFVATNIWQYENLNTTPTLVSDGTVKLHEVGHLVKLWEFNINDTSLIRRYFSDRPNLDPETIWGLAGALQFGDEFEANIEGTEDPNLVETVSDIRTYERSQWGIVGFPDGLYYHTTATNTITGPVNNTFVANIDYTLPGLKIEENVEDVVGTGPLYTYQRPTYIWHKQNHKNFYMKMYVGQPDDSTYPPIDVLFRAPIDSNQDTYLYITDSGNLGTGEAYIIVKGSDWNDIPQRGTVRFLTKEVNEVWRYTRKALTNSASGEVMLVSSTALPGVVDSTATELSLAVILHEDYDTYCARMEFSINSNPGAENVQLQFRVGKLDMTQPYELDQPTQIWDDLVKGFADGEYLVSRWYTQDGFYTGSGSVSGSPDNFIVYPGGILNGSESWNKFEMMVRDGQCWIWWNELLITPDAFEISQLVPPTDLDGTNPYFDVQNAAAFGKVGLRLWPGAKIRALYVLNQNIGFNELCYGQLEVVAG